MKLLDKNRPIDPKNIRAVSRLSTGKGDMVLHQGAEDGVPKPTILGGSDKTNDGADGFRGEGDW